MFVHKNLPFFSCYEVCGELILTYLKEDSYFFMKKAVDFWFDFQKSTAFLI